ncbi:MAG: TonB-dependent receptor, partial [Methylibium sp.]|nr:TonB-dependent receptor [Methylibium sp.]
LATLTAPLSVLAQQAPDAAASAPEAAPPAAAVRLNPVLVPGKRATDVGPMPGLAVTKDQIPANIQSATKEQIKESRALNIGDYMNSQLQGVSVNDYSGNPFQMDVNYRGFTASPQIGTPQGLSVFFDGVRVNEPFGDVVNWDLIPLNAIERFDLFPGSNPLFGLNTLGGAISVRSKNGFTAPGVEGELLAGSWGRKQVKLSAGANDDTLGGFLAYTGFREDGWRDNSPSHVNQLFGRSDLRLDRGSLFASALYANNELIGNGLIPLALFEQRAETVFTSPDRSDNRVLQLALGGQFDVSETFNVTGQIYTRKSKRGGLNGDIYEGFDDMIGLRGGYFDPDNPA